jgi:hypothetical protein
MSGLQEILLIAVILMGILFLPRILPTRTEQRPKNPVAFLSRKMRVAIVASIVYPAIAALFLQPWNRDVMTFMYAGFGPVALGWLGYWAFTGRKK